MNFRNYITWSLRDIFWLILLVCFNLGWYINKVKPVKDLEKKIGEQHWEMEFRKNQVAIERKAQRELGDNMNTILTINERLINENEHLKTLLTPSQREVFRKWRTDNHNTAPDALGKVLRRSSGKDVVL